MNNVWFLRGFSFPFSVYSAQSLVLPLISDIPCSPQPVQGKLLAH